MSNNPKTYKISHKGKVVFEKVFLYDNELKTFNDAYDSVVEIKNAEEAKTKKRVKKVQPRKNPVIRETNVPVAVTSGEQFTMEFALVDASATNGKPLTDLNGTAYYVPLENKTDGSSKDVISIEFVDGVGKADVTLDAIGLWEANNSQIRPVPSAPFEKQISIMVLKKKSKS